MSIQNDKQKAPHGQRSWDASFIDVINFWRPARCDAT